MQDNKYDWRFWRDEAKLSIFDPEKRAKCLFIVLAGSLSLLLIFIFAEDLGMDEVIIRTMCGCAFVLLWPTLLAIEMFYKGSKAGVRLKQEAGAEIAAREQDRADLQRVLGQQEQVIKDGVAPYERESQRLSVELGEVKEKLMRADGNVADLRREIEALKKSAERELGEKDKRIAELEDVMRPQFRTEANKRSDGVFMLKVFNDSPLASHQVSVVIDSIDIEESQDPNGANELIEYLTGQRLKARNKKIAIDIPGKGSGHFYLFGAGFITEECMIHETMGRNISDVIQGRAGSFPDGRYLVHLLVGGVGASMRADCRVASSGEKIEFDWLG